MARNNADLAHEIEELIKKYNKKPEKKIKKRDIIELFQQCELLLQKLITATVRLWVNLLKTHLLNLML